MITHAAIIPLHYEPGRTEYSVVIVANHVNDLVTILTDPKTVLFEERESNQIPGGVRPPSGDYDRMSFPYDPRDPNGPLPEWELLFPITAIIQRGYKEHRAVRGFREPRNAKFVASLASEDADRLGLDLTSLAFGDDELRRLYPNGCVYAEFALNTRTLFIIFYESSIVYDDDTRIYGKGITKATLAKPQTGLSEKGTVHFDLESHDPLGRAEFIVNWLDDPEHILDLVREKTSHFESEPTLQKRGIPFVRGAGVNDLAGGIDLTFSNGPYLFPDVVVEGLSTGLILNDELVEPCTVLVVEPCDHDNDPDTPPVLCTRTMLVKSYQAGSGMVESPKQSFPPLS